MQLSSRLLLLVLLVSISSMQASTATNLRCEYREQPLGIDVLNPRLSWILQSGRRGDRQTAYQILVASSSDLLALDKGDRWDSGQVISDETNQIRYLGEPIGSRARCYWKVRTWNEVNQPSGLEFTCILDHGLDQRRRLAGELDQPAAIARRSDPSDHPPRDV